MDLVGINKKRTRLVTVASSLLVVLGSLTSIVAASAPAEAGLIVPNRMLCEPDTGWCFQTNPPYDPSVYHLCIWDYKLNGNKLQSGMWYTGCDKWDPAIY